MCPARIVRTFEGSSSKSILGGCVESTVEMFALPSAEMFVLLISAWTMTAMSVESLP